MENNNKKGLMLVRRLIPPLLIVLLLVGCSSGGGGPSATVEVEAALRAFEKATNVVNEQGEYDVSWARENVLKLSYNKPSNAFWSLAMWLQTERYIFKDWTISIDGSRATVVLTYSTVNSVDKTERPPGVKTFTMQKFGDGWRVNLAEFLDLD